MKKQIFLISLSLIFNTIIAQDCLPVKEGGELHLSSISYPTPVEKDINKWTKLKPSKKDVIIKEHNENVLKGKIKPKYTFDMIYTAQSINEKEGIYNVNLITTINGVDYESNISCKNDTLYLARKLGLQEANSPQGEKIGYSLLGVQEIPKSLKVGDTLMPYIDYTFTYPKEKIVDWNVKTGSGSSYAGFGMSRSWVSYVTLQILETTSFMTLQMQNMNAVVKGTTPFKLGKETYEAYIIESEIWTRTYPDIKYQSDDRRVGIEKLNDKMDAYWTKKTDKRMKRKGIADDGWIKSYKTEWFVPEFGIVNLVVMSQGFITNETRLVKIK